MSPRCGDISTPISALKYLELFISEPPPQRSDLLG
jgi:hypothetical protein